MNSCNLSLPIMHLGQKPQKVSSKKTVKSEDSVVKPECLSPGGHVHVNGDSWVPVGDDRCRTCMCQV